MSGSTIWLLLFVVAVLGGSVIIKIGLVPFTDETLPRGYPRAGMIIGILERTIFWFCLESEQSAIIGFVLTIKAIYRFGDIQGDNKAKMKLSEYFIIGTLYSLGWTLLVWLVLSVTGE